MATSESNIPSSSRKNGQPSSKNKDKKDDLCTQLWLACAGSLVQVPQAGDKVFYFPQGHIEQVEAYTNQDCNFEMPIYNLPSKILCKLVNIQLKAEANTDEVFAQITLLPESEESVIEDSKSKSKTRTAFLRSFSKKLTPSDTSTHGGFSVLKRHADECFPPLDLNQVPPSQELVAKDLNGTNWKFRHIYRGQPRRNLITSGWSLFVNAKKLVAGDTVLFFRWEHHFGTDAVYSKTYEEQFALEVLVENRLMLSASFTSSFRGEGRKLLVGVRRASRPQNTTPTSFISGLSMQHGILATAFHAMSTGSMFTVYYRPWSSPGEFIIPYDQYVRSAEIGYSFGMRFRMQFEVEDNNDYKCIKAAGKIVGIEDVDHLRWPDSDWRKLKVTNPHTHTQTHTLTCTLPPSQNEFPFGEMEPDLPERVSPWSIELFNRYKMKHIPVTPNLKRSFPFDHPLSPNVSFQVLQGQETRASENPLKRVPTNIYAPEFTSPLENNELTISEVNFVSEPSNPSPETSNSRKCMLFGVDIMNGLLSPRGTPSQSSIVECLNRYTKIVKYGNALVRSINLDLFDGYEELARGVDYMFDFKGSLRDGSSGWYVTYLGGEGDLMLLGDCPWPEFRAMVRKMFICPAEDAENAGPNSSS